MGIPQARAIPTAHYDSWAYEARVEKYVDAVLDRAYARHGDIRQQLLPEGEPQRALYKYHSAWREQLHHDAAGMGCGQLILWMGAVSYTGIATTIALAAPPIGLLTLLPLLPGVPLLFKWVGFPRSFVPSPSTPQVRAIDQDAYEVRREMDLEKHVGWKGHSWTAESFGYFREHLRKRIEDLLEAFYDGIDQQNSAGFGVGVEKLERWIGQYLELWDMAALYDLESRRYANSSFDGDSENRFREWLGITVDEARIAVLFAAGGSYERSKPAW